MRSLLAPSLSMRSNELPVRAPAGKLRTIILKLISRLNLLGSLNTVVPGFRALGPSMAKSALNPGSALFPRLDLVHYVL